MSMRHLLRRLLVAEIVGVVVAFGLLVIDLAGHPMIAVAGLAGAFLGKQISAAEKTWRELRQSDGE